VGIAWWNAHAEEMRGPDLPVSFLGPWAKLKSYAARIALVLHFIWQVPGDQEEGAVNAADVERAVRLIHYFKAHLRLVHGRLLQTSEDCHLEQVIEWLRRNGGRCRARDLVRAKQVRPTDRAKKLMRELAEREYGRLEFVEAANGRKVEEFVLDPS
jgi:hypothetical protein